jgi:hypothetical protein
VLLRKSLRVPLELIEQPVTKVQTSEQSSSLKSTESLGEILYFSSEMGLNIFRQYLMVIAELLSIIRCFPRTFGEEANASEEKT